MASTSCPCGIRLLECTVDEETRTRSLAGWWAMRLDPCPLLEQSSDVCAVTSSYCFTCTSCYWLHSTGDLRQQVILSLEFRLKITEREWKWCDDVYFLQYNSIHGNLEEGISNQRFKRRQRNMILIETAMRAQCLYETAQRSMVDLRNLTFPE